MIKETIKLIKWKSRTVLLNRMDFQFVIVSPIYGQIWPRPKAKLWGNLCTQVRIINPQFTDNFLTCQWESYPRPCAGLRHGKHSPSPLMKVLALYNYYLPPVHWQLSHMPMGVLIPDLVQGWDTASTPQARWWRFWLYITIIYPQFIANFLTCQWESYPRPCAGLRHGKHSPSPLMKVLAVYNYYLPPVHCQLSHMPMGVLPQTLCRAETRQALPQPADEGFGFI